MKCCGPADILTLAIRLFLGGLFIVMGLTKGLAPVEFLKVVRQYNAFDNHVLLNFVAATLPWFEVFCGFLLIAGIAIRGTALLLVGMLVPFTILIFLRALNLHQGSNLPFCAIKFDCGCGSGEVLVCRKLAENAGLIVLSLWLIFWQKHRWGIRPALFPCCARAPVVSESVLASTPS